MSKLRDMLERKLESAGNDIKGALLEWGSVVMPTKGNWTLGSVLEQQIHFLAIKRKKPEREIVDDLFDASSAEEFLLLLQL